MLPNSNMRYVSLVDPRFSQCAFSREPPANCDSIFGSFMHVFDEKGIANPYPF